VEEMKIGERTFGGVVFFRKSDLFIAGSLESVLKKKNSEELSANSFGISSSADLSFSSKYRGE